ncbi:iron complex transport system permease protein [Kribbella sp. VKM Ac-2527]|uniref:Iron complex transport system permease protein n=1 Tax=Kribbella caucasensis TaxID=2512215 RepID=A0A4R6K946_9ACTN|nr:iron ABC transporter permease [Kribbella sp. VKM Ac-2527]TDO45697.1 iron complex transport system permease protein [Kribbella sp. VKM Ac-2527]
MSLSAGTLPRPAESGDGEHRRPRIVTSKQRVTWVTAALLLVLVAGIVWSLSIGSQHIPLTRLPGAIFKPDETDELIVHSIRLPRVVLALCVGAALAVAGALMQAVAANPLAAPEIMGVNAGAVLVVVLAVTIVPSLSGAPTILLAFGGAAAAGISVMLLAGSGRGRVSPVRLALAGVTASSLLISLTQVLIIFDENSTDSVLFWLVGGVNYAGWHDIRILLPWLVFGLLGSFALARSLNLLALGDDMARGLGQNVERTRIFGSALVIVLCGAAVSVAGPVAFIGLIVPHILRRLVGSSYTVLLPLCSIGGGVLILYADVVSRYVRPPYEVPAGVVTALIGAPIFVYLARRQKVTS